MLYYVQICFIMSHSISEMKHAFVLADLHLLIYSY